MSMSHIPNVMVPSKAHPLSESHGIPGIPLMNLTICEIRSVLLGRVAGWKS